MATQFSTDWNLNVPHFVVVSEHMDETWDSWKLLIILGALTLYNHPFAASLHFASQIRRTFYPQSPRTAFESAFSVISISGWPCDGLPAGSYSLVH